MFNKSGVAETALAQALFKQSTVAVGFCTPKGKWIQANPALLQLLGFTEKELLNTDLARSVHFDDRSAVRHYLENITQHNQSERQLEHRWIHKDGSVIWLSASYMFVSGGNEQPDYIVVLAQNMTAHKAALKNLADREAWYRQILESTREGVWRLDENFKTCYANPALCSMLGSDIQELSHLSLLDFVAEEEQPALIQQLKLNKQGYANQYDIELIRKDGGRMIATVVSEQLSSASGMHTGFVIGVIDSSKRHQMEDELRLSEAVYLNAGDAIYITDANGKIVKANPAFYQLTGYSVSETVGQSPMMFRAGGENDHTCQLILQRMRESGCWEGEIYNRKKNGELFCAWENISTVKDDTGNLRYHVSILTDISGIKKQQQQLNFLAHHDPLTRLPNRTLFFANLNQSLRVSRRNRHAVALIFIDLDDFKPVNDRYGHHIGDEVLKVVAERIQDSVRDEDTVARLGGDEFTILMPSVMDQDDVQQLVDRVHQVLKQTILINELNVSIGASLGVSMYPNDVEDEYALLQAADKAMYRAKQHEDRHCVFFSDMADS
ncbi:PAS domain S-box protein [Pleionea sp. CnH1-48]|uniref:sensor domain-containing protein n=1 Tax=Pleionea sp. CnH1-48 TaxID=2954494 RepID=UPI0020976FA7|nr:PAS domain S-box protein [Pleionea sp. CnH1-48]